jgi:hypothetical protein
MGKLATNNIIVYAQKTDFIPCSIMAIALFPSSAISIRNQLELGDRRL